MRYLIPFLLLLSACITRTSDVIPDGQGAYTIIETGKTGFVSSADLRIRALQRASAYCSGKGLQLETISANEQRGGVLGKFPEADIHFRCIARK